MCEFRLMRARQKSSFPYSPSSTLALALVLGAWVHSGVAAQSSQNSPGTFTLPEPTPTPTPAPQGPVDIRDGVVIGPRNIPTERATPTPTPAPTPTPSATPPSQPAPTATPTPSTTRAPSSGGTLLPARPTLTPSSEPGRASESQSTGNAETTSNDNAGSLPGFGEPNTSGLPSLDTESPNSLPAEPVTAPETGMRETPVWVMIAAGLAAILALLAALGWWLRRRRIVAAATPKLLPAPALAAGVRKSMAETQNAGDAAPQSSANQVESDFAGEQIATAVAAPKAMDLKLDIISASRSVMMFTVEYRLTIANRSGSALRDLAMSVRLACARRGVNETQNAPLQMIERIGPHQSRAISGELRLPLSEIEPMRQGATPLFIPLLSASVSVAGDTPKTHNFVIGTPSAASTTRLHPIALDTTPGGIPNIRAQEIKDMAGRKAG